MGSKTRFNQTRNAATDEMEEPPANSETVGDCGHEKACQVSNDAELGSGIQTISKEIRGITNGVKRGPPRVW